MFCYYRYSSSAQRDDSIEQQRKEAQKYCKKKGYRIVKEFEDRAISGTIFERPGLQQMLIEAKRERPTALIVWKTDRLSRDRYDSARIKGQLESYGVRTEYVAEPMPEDESSRMIMESLYEAFAAQFILQHTKNVERGMRSNAEKAIYNGRRILGYKGVPQQPYQIDSDTAEIVVKIFSEYSKGNTMRGIANMLNDAGFKTLQGYNFTEKTLWHILHNRSYIGEYKWGDIIVPNGMPRLVSDELFYKVQEMMEENKHNGRGEAKEINKLRGIDFWLTGHLYCGKCGTVMSGTSGTGKSGNLYYYYTCNNKKKHKCDKKSVKKESIEKIVTHILRECLNDTSLKLFISLEVYRYYVQEYGADESLIISLKKQINEIDKKLKNIMKAIEDGIYDAMLQSRIEELNEQKSRLCDELTLQENLEKYSLKQEDILRYLDSFVDFEDKNMRRRILDYLIEKIYLYDDKIVISFFYSDDKREIDFETYNNRIELWEHFNGKGILDNVCSSSVEDCPLIKF